MEHIFFNFTLAVNGNLPPASSSRICLGNFGAKLYRLCANGTKIDTSGQADPGHEMLWKPFAGARASHS